jgi:hypothetical protein
VIGETAVSGSSGSRTSLSEAPGAVLAGGVASGTREIRALASHRRSLRGSSKITEQAPSTVNPASFAAWTMASLISAPNRRPRMGPIKPH